MSSSSPSSTTLDADTADDDSLSVMFCTSKKVRLRRGIIYTAKAFLVSICFVIQCINLVFVCLEKRWLVAVGFSITTSVLFIAAWLLAMGARKSSTKILLGYLILSAAISTMFIAEAIYTFFAFGLEWGAFCAFLCIFLVAVSGFAFVIVIQLYRALKKHRTTHDV